MNEKFDIYKRLLISGALTLKYKSLILLVRNYMNGKNKIGIATLEGIEFIRVEEIIRCEGLMGFGRGFVRALLYVIFEFANSALRYWQTLNYFLNPNLI